MTPHLEYLLRIGDSTLILGQRLAEWCGHAPVLEEDIALANVALDLIGQSRLVLTHAAGVEGAGRDEDQLAFLRTEGQFRNVTLVELPNGDFGRTVLRSFLFCAFLRELWTALATSSDTGLAAIAAKSVKESRYHVQHAGEWVIRLGDGTDESHARMQRALDDLWPYTAELFAATPVDDAVRTAGIGVDWASLRTGWEATVLPALDEATLGVPAASAFVSRGKLGVHSEHMGHLLTEMQYLQRTYPGATW
ncbi:MAG: phenylacetate-CoA oxygenase subunit PaaC [Burkholderiales bacterium]|nr:phenylacetate-CoA oxygenase subunit PaaC [Burkholderiales bacterium]